MNIFINNKQHSFTSPLPVSEILRLSSGIPSTGIAVAVNNEVIPSSEWDKHIVNDGDRITIIKAFYGG